ncbi:AadA family aminoglycoside 3''-O-nucleotidyltransferase [Burkholderia cenocepacia]|uniref:Aminoglycoside (3'') (9) adenylyltransferase n=1 Tax=Burkholderia cenocepacia TaxID=95486 RepID=A0ABD4U9P5_9BURK|nr:AadA family aminoglycoside 3''-O-nucleotidyltransferase [Burkholderia cenocepacia]MBR8406523.1 AadA family aminoglycoside 3''-O-nucleotidyltransferase [Burkholderia cenocepacia]MCW3693872.1 AadA family aminoglycoside 3''-O-nucleotidyltransferase [Burkholderia cenocepacia]MCW3702223.1 AadA family aminoglycoside 3''-O-nucleotidyltransferase [Burkholderia cenocepacia]MCW3711023.1 AadA family aminoglycoside 3''-O-nucleotidyltransferase [Burkholderia cenocepacia]MCW3718983.1 AadA family aminogly
MTDDTPHDIAAQVAAARVVIERHLGATLEAIHLFGSALDGGLKPRSDIDLLVTVAVRPDEAARRALMSDLLGASAPPGCSGGMRALEVTVVAHGDVVPWRHPARRELQFGEWLRSDLDAGIVEPPLVDHDLAILLTKAREHSIALVGPPADVLFEPVPARDFVAALLATVAQWQAEPDWRDDACNIVLALARIWYSAATGKIAPKDVAAAWVLARLPDAHRPVLAAARTAYLDGDAGAAILSGEPLAEFIGYARRTIESMLSA